MGLGFMPKFYNIFVLIEFVMDTKKGRSVYVKTYNLVIINQPSAGERISAYFSCTLDFGYTAQPQLS